MKELKVNIPDWAFEFFNDGWDYARINDTKFIERKKIETFEDYVSWAICELIQGRF